MGEVVNGVGKRTLGSHGKTIYRGSLTENNSSQSSPKANASAHVKEDVAVLARQLAAVRGSVRGSFALDTCDDIRRIFGVFSRSMSPRAKMISLEHKPTCCFIPLKWLFAGFLICEVFLPTNRGFLGFLISRQTF